MHEHQICVGVDGADRPQREDVVGAFQHPTPGVRRLMLQVLQEALVKAIGVEMPGVVEPLPVARDAIGRVEAQAGEDVRRDLRALLRGTGPDRMQTAELRRQHLEQAQLAGDLLRRRSRPRPDRLIG